jgi:hypothetical protein
MKKFLIVAAFIAMSIPMIGYTQVLRGYDKMNSGIYFIKANLNASLSTNVIIARFDGLEAIENNNIGRACFMIGELSAITSQLSDLARNPVLNTDYFMFDGEEMAQIMKLDANASVLANACKNGLVNIEIANEYLKKVAEDYKVLRRL